MEKQIILFDGVCNLCNGFVNFMIDRDKKAKFLFCSLQSERGQQILAKHNLDTQKLSSVVLVSHSKAYQKSTAVLLIARQLCGLWSLFYVFMLIPAPFRNLLYDWVARNRYRWFGKQDACRMPTPDLKSRFL